MVASASPTGLLDVRDPERLETAAIAIASSGNPADLAELSRRLGEPTFLLQLDPKNGAEASVVHLANVFRALAQHPSANTGALCLALAQNANFTAVPARLNFLLDALAAVRPMSKDAARLFRTTDESGFIEVNGPLLARNASPLALEVLTEILQDQKSDVAQRVSIAHWALPPMRTNPDIVMMSARIVQQEALSPEVRVAILESLYDYQPRRWFGLEAGQPAPAAWNAAPDAALTPLRSLGTRMLSRPDLPADIAMAIRRTLDQLPAKVGP